MHHGHVSQSWPHDGLRTCSWTPVDVEVVSSCSSKPRTLEPKASQTSAYERDPVQPGGGGS